MASRIPGTRPARKSLLIESSVSSPSTISMPLGGIRLPIVPPAAMLPVARGGAVAVLLHLGQRHESHGGDGCHGRGADRRKARAAPHCRHRKASALMAQPLCRHLVQVLSHARLKHHVRHEDEQRQHPEREAGNGVEGNVGQLGESRLGRAQVGETAKGHQAPC